MTVDVRPVVGTLDALRSIFAATVGTYRSAIQRLVVLALADHVDHNGECHPGVARLAVMTDTSDSTVRRELRDLADRGLLVKMERRRHADGSLGVWRYRLMVPVETAAEPVDEPPVTVTARDALPVTGERPTGHSCDRAEVPKNLLVEPSTGEPPARSPVTGGPTGHGRRPATEARAALQASRRRRTADP